MLHQSSKIYLQKGIIFKLTHLGFSENNLGIFAVVCFSLLPKIVYCLYKQYNFLTNTENKNNVLK